MRGRNFHHGHAARLALRYQRCHRIQRRHTLRGTLLVFLGRALIPLPGGVIAQFAQRCIARGGGVLRCFLGQQLRLREAGQHADPVFNAATTALPAAPQAAFRSRVAPFFAFRL